MSYYYAIYTDKPLEEMMEKHPERSGIWVYNGKREYVWIHERDSSKDPNGADELRLTEYFYFAGFGMHMDEITDLADDCLKRTGGKMYVTELISDPDESVKISKKAEILDLKDISEKLRDSNFRSIVDTESYVIYEVVNSGCKNE